jgi:hypothetical protein
VGANGSYESPQGEINEKRRILFPIRLVKFDALLEWDWFDDVGMDAVDEIRGYYIPDFTQWKDHDQYQKAFDRLLRDMKAETERAAGSREHAPRSTATGLCALTAAISLARAERHFADFHLLGIACRSIYTKSARAHNESRSGPPHSRMMNRNLKPPPK